MGGTGNRHPPRQGNEAVGVAGHAHRIAPRRQDPGQPETFGQHQIFFQQAIDAAGAGIDAAMARIDHHDLLARAAFSPAAGGGNQGRQFFGITLPLFEVGRPAGIGIEFDLLGGKQVDHHPVAEAGAGRQHQGIAHRHRTVEIDHHARIALAEQAVAIGLDRAEAAGQRRRPQLPGDFRHIHHHPVGTAQGEGAQIHRIGKFDHQPGAVVMLADAGAHYDGGQADGIAARR